MPNDGPSITEILLENGASPKIQDNEGRIPLKLAARYGCSAEGVKVLAEASLPTKSEWNYLLYEASAYGLLDVLEYFLDQGADPCVEFEDEDSALFRAMDKSIYAKESVDLFFKYGARGDFKTKSGKTALHHLATQYKKECTQEWMCLFIQHGAALEALHDCTPESSQQSVPLTPLWEACAIGIHDPSSPVIKAFIAVGANPYVEIKPGKTFLCTSKTG